MSGDQAEAVAAESSNPRGRPSKYDPAYCDRVMELGSQGLSYEQISAQIGADRATMNRWADVHPEFRTALTRAKELEQAWWERVGQTALFADKFQAAVWSKSMSARFREKYTDKVSQEISGPNGGPQRHVFELEIVGNQKQD
jgi:hypothetical protein